MIWSTRMIVAAAVAATPTSALYSGFALEPKLSTGLCRTQQDWEDAFTRLASFPGKFESVRLFSSGECDTLEHAVPAAVKTGTSLLVGIWTEDEAFFEAEKNALIHAIQMHGSAWMLGVIVGSQDLYQNETTAPSLATKIYDVRGMINSVGCHQPVGHADTPEAWTNAANAAVITASDFLGVNNYPYWKGIAVDAGAANNNYWQATDRVRAVAQGKQVWTTETGQPTAGQTYGANKPSVPALQTYWWQVACQSMKEMNFFYYDLDDFHLSPQFAVVDELYRPLIDMTCH